MKTKVLTFFIIGLLIYLIDIAFNSYDKKEIFISEDEIISLITAWESQVGRSPNEDEINRIINEYIEEEILYREALNLGLEREDRIIKRRLAQKITFLKQESFINKFTNIDVENYYKNNLDKYLVKPSYTFTHYYFSSDNRSIKRANIALDEINNDKKNFKSDPFILGKNFVNKNASIIDREFGLNFSNNFLNQPTNKWIGPFMSSYGHHLIYIKKINDGYQPKLLDIYFQVELDLNNSKKEELLDKYLYDIKNQYTIIIDSRLQIND